MAWTLTDLDKLEAAIASGVQTVRYADKQVTYQTLEDMLKAREVLRQALSDTKRPSRLFASFRKGTCR